MQVNRSKSFNTGSGLAIDPANHRHNTHTDTIYSYIWVTSLAKIFVVSSIGSIECGYALPVIYCMWWCCTYSVYREALQTQLSSWIIVNINTIVWPDPLPNHYARKGLGTWPYQICSAAHILQQLITVSNYWEWPSSTTNENFCMCQPPFQR